MPKCSYGRVSFETVEQLWIGEGVTADSLDHDRRLGADALRS